MIYIIHTIYIYMSINWSLVSAEYVNNNRQPQYVTNKRLILYEKGEWVKIGYP